MILALVGLLLLIAAWLFSPRDKQIKHKKARKDHAMTSLDSALIADMCAASLECGMAIPRALSALDDALECEEGKRGLKECAHLLVMGASWEEAWEESDERFHFLAYQLEPAWKNGAAPVDILRRSAHMTRSQRSRRAREAAGELSSALVLPLGACFLPAFVLLGVVPVVVAAASKVLG